LNMPASLVGFAFTEAALSHLESIPHKERAQIIKKAKGLQLNNHPQGSKMLKGVQAKGGEKIFRERSGDYRIIYLVRTNPKEVIILDINHRKDIYR
jgi:mRNA interferase RelE/StbE